MRRHDCKFKSLTVLAAFCPRYGKMGFELYITVTWNKIFLREKIKSWPEQILHHLSLMAIHRESLRYVKEPHRVHFARG